LLGQLPVLCYWIKKKKEQQADAEVNTDELKELIREITGLLPSLFQFCNK